VNGACEQTFTCKYCNLIFNRISTRTLPHPPFNSTSSWLHLPDSHTTATATATLPLASSRETQGSADSFFVILLYSSPSHIQLHQPPFCLHLPDFQQPQPYHSQSSVQHEFCGFILLFSSTIFQQVSSYFLTFTYLLHNSDMSSQRIPSSSSSECSAVDTIMPSRNAAGHVTQAGKTPHYIKRQMKAFEDEATSERMEESEQSVHSGDTDFMSVYLSSDAGRSESPCNSDHIHISDDTTLQSNAQGHRTEGGKGPSSSSPNLKQEFVSRLQGSNTRKTYSDKRPPTMRTTTTSGKRFPGTSPNFQDLARPTTSRKNLAGLKGYAGKFTPFQ
jgi:hypothetical protein